MKVEKKHPTLVWMRDAMVEAYQAKIAGIDMISQALPTTEPADSNPAANKRPVASTLETSLISNIVISSLLDLERGSCLP